MLKPGEIHVWRIQLDKVNTPPPTTGEAARAGRFATPTLRRRYLRAHGALRDILGRYTDGRLDFALHEKGKPFLPNLPDLEFNLSHSKQMALVAVARGTPVGVDIERLRPLIEFAAIAERYFPPDEVCPSDAPDFFRRWTRFEAILKAQGLGLYGAGASPEGSWTVQELDAGPGFAAAVAARGTGHTIVIHDYGETAA
ncbi:MAG: 4-phosphopantetheinyl transferase [Candidatus Solibacter sp.]|jgi:4'-phosphopantetheinyl transferase|nr:4-phosphopantetheinyl transferase [Candidatus Solibacter sp.]